MRETLKKSESLEIRIPYPTKQAFMARCRADGRSASAALREMIEARLAPPRMRWRQVAAALLAAAGMAAVAAPSLARTGMHGFDRLDRNRDGVVTAAEFRALDADGDGAVSAREAQR
jgi:hypothetical protein